MKSETDKLDFDKLVPVLSDLSKSSDVVKDYIVKKNVYHAKIATNTLLNAKMNEAKNKIPSISNLATTTAFTAVNWKENYHWSWSW